MKYSLAFSPCPNDTYITGALVNRHVASRFDYLVHMADVEELNLRAMDHEFDVTKLSFHAYAHCADHYDILPVGAALGFGNGPLIVSRRKIYPDEIPQIHMAIPGKYTTAVLISELLLGKVDNKTEYLFSDIPKVVMDGECDAGLLIHETRFTYEKMGLKKICDLGELWEKETSLPLPLGCFVVRKSLPEEIKKEIANDLHESLRFANRDVSLIKNYIMQHAQEMAWEVAESHIRTFVNAFTENLGEQGRKAIDEMFRRAKEKGVIENVEYRVL